MILDDDDLSDFDDTLPKLRDDEKVCQRCWLALPKGAFTGRNKICDLCRE